MILYHPDYSQAGIRVMHLRGRYKDGLKIQRSILRVSYNENDFRDQISILTEQLLPGERIYVSAGSRDFVKATLLFDERLYKNKFSQNPEAFWKKLPAIWVSCLMNPKAQLEKVWLFDCDNESDSNLLQEELNKHYKREMPPYWYNTKNGKHAITQPFNPSVLSEQTKALLHRNPYMLYAY